MVISTWSNMSVKTTLSSERQITVHKRVRSIIGLKILTDHEKLKKVFNTLL